MIQNGYDENLLLLRYSAELTELAECVRSGIISICLRNFAALHAKLCAVFVRGHKRIPGC